MPYLVEDSKAFSMSRKTVDEMLSLLLISSVIRMSWCIVEHLFGNPNFCCGRMFLSVISSVN